MPDVSARISSSRFGTGDLLVVWPRGSSGCGLSDTSLCSGAGEHDSGAGEVDGGSGKCD
jgi:hypothetical protein